MSTPGGPSHDALRPAQEVSERALEASRSTECMVRITDVYEANVRFANNTATTNGVKRDRRVNVISLVGVHGGYGIPLTAGRYETVLPPETVADLVVLAVDACSGLGAEDGRNVYSAAGHRARVGERLTELPFTLESGPDLPGLEGAPFGAVPASDADQSVFDNGLSIGSTRWMESGVLQRLRYSRAGCGRRGDNLDYFHHLCQTDRYDRFRSSGPGPGARTPSHCDRDRGSFGTSAASAAVISPRPA